MKLDFEKPRYQITEAEGQLTITPALPDYIKTKLTDHFGEQNIGINGGEDHTSIEVGQLKPPVLTDLLADLRFLSLHPHVAVENICSRLGNFIPKNPSQEQALDWSNMLVDYAGSSAAGLFIFGPAGIGKTHLAVGVAKELDQRKRPSHFISHNNLHNYNSAVFNPRLSFDGDFWIFNDLNSPYGFASDVYRNLVYSLHDSPGKIIITANISLESLNRAITQRTPHDSHRFIDRVANLFKVVNMTGDSQREQAAWFDPKNL